MTDSHYNTDQEQDPDSSQKYREMMFYIVVLCSGRIHWDIYWSALTRTLTKIYIASSGTRRRTKIKIIKGSFQTRSQRWDHWRGCWAPGGATPYSGLYREAPPERGAYFKLAVYKRVGKIAILVSERVTKSAAKWKKWWLKRRISKGATFWQKWLRNWIRTTEHPRKPWRLLEILLFWLILEV